MATQSAARELRPEDRHPAVTSCPDCGAEVLLGRLPWGRAIVVDIQYTPVYIAEVTKESPIPTLYESLGHAEHHCGNRPPNKEKKACP